MRDANQLPLTHDALYKYLDEWSRPHLHDPVLDAMEAYADQQGIPLIGRPAGRYLELAARSIGARRIFELSPGFGYSSYWFARAVGEAGEVICADEEPESPQLAKQFMEDTEQWPRMRYQTGNALAILDQTDGKFDVIFCDALKKRYPECWRAAAGRIRIGGLWIADNSLWHGGVVTGQDVNEATTGYTAAVIEHNRLVASDPRFVSSLVPIRDGLMVALRIR